jgi:putative peptide zinc metalloprotease protein
LYLIFPAFYADVSEAWRLSRSRRAVVDAGGIFMSLICATACSAVFLVTGEQVWGLLSITVVWNLNPFLRMDGYWLISDWLGVQNLMNVNKGVTRWLVRKALGKTPQRPTILSSAYQLRFVYAAYYFGFLLFAGYASVQLTLNYVPALLRTYTDVCRTLMTAIMQPPENWVAIPSAAWHWLLVTVPILGILLLVVRMSEFVAESLRVRQNRHVT